jgi:hypothetical protein
MAGRIEQFAPTGDNEGLKSTSPAPSKARNFWRTGLLLTSSAALGGIAVAIWNRRSLARIRQKYESKAVQAGNHEDDILN